MQLPATQTRNITDSSQACAGAAFLRQSPLFVTAASISGFALSPIAAVAGTMGVWRLGADLGWAGAFFVDEGLLARYQLWLAFAVVAQSSAFILDRWVASQRRPASF
jgi:hypothetical protein